MSKMVHIEMNNHVYLFSCESRNTRSGFAHDCTLYRDYNVINHGTCHYLNRTWESWMYQSVCITAIQNEIDWKIEHIRDNYKYTNNISRIAGKRKEEVQYLIDNDDYIKELTEVKKILKEGLF